MLWRSWLVDLALASSAAVSFCSALLWSYRRLASRGTCWPLDTLRILASDTGIAPPLTLHDQANGLCGRPDYLLEQRLGDALSVVPIEIKPQRRSRRLYESDAVQLDVYLLTARATYGVRAAPFGYVRYALAEFRVELTQELERRVLQVAAAIRADREATVVHRSHVIPTRCAGCPVRDHCDESLV